MSEEKMKILFAASEANPFIKTGGLADVVGALPKYLKKNGVDARIVIPKYKDINFFDSYLECALQSMCVKMGDGEEWCSVWKTKTKDDVEVYFIEHHKYFNRDGLYHDNAFNDYQDNPYRYGFFCQAALQMCQDIDFYPDVIHTNDWQTSAISAYIKIWYWDKRIGKTATLLTIHNVAYQGIYPSFKTYSYLGLGWKNYSSNTFEDNGNINLLKGGIFFSDVVTTVSKNYAGEISSPYGGFGMAPYLTNKTTSFFGILNGIDTKEWDPKTDFRIAANYSEKDMSGKKKCKLDLQKRFMLEENEDIMVLGVVGRFTGQKGFHILQEVLSNVLNSMHIQFVILGAGDKSLEDFFGNLPKAFPGQAGSYIGFSNEIAHIIEAGADAFIMPSLFEPCGLNQMYSKRYGTLPIVHATGGLEDTVENYDENTGAGTGFKTYEVTPVSLYYTIGWAVSTFYDRKEHYQNMQKQAMACDHSWEKSAKEYIKAYEIAIKNKKAYDESCSIRQ